MSERERNPLDAYVTFGVELDLSELRADELALAWGAHRLPFRPPGGRRLFWRELAVKNSDPNDTEMFERALRSLLERVSTYWQELHFKHEMIAPPTIHVVISLTPDSDSTEKYARIPADVLPELMRWGASVEVFIYDVQPDGGID